MRRLRATFGIGVAAAVLVGCNSQKQVGFDASLRQATMELQTGRLHEAEASIAAASTVASGEAEKAKVADLEHLVQGTKRYMDGDVLAADDAWRQIEDPSLRSQVLAKSGRQSTEEGTR